jgi:hypothetical protein
VDYLTQELEGKGLQLAAKDEEIGLLRGRIAELEAAAVQVGWAAGAADHLAHAAGRRSHGQ